jgi:ribosomal protein S18 acetylase RimI-like enzyme
MFDEMSFSEGFSLRLANVNDQPFMEELFRSTREHFYLMPLPKQQVELLIKQQFVLQQSAYATQFPAASHYVIEFAGEPIGKITLNKTEVDFHLIDIIVASRVRNRGYGTHILRSIQNLAEKKKRQLRLSVDQENQRAKKLYLALGFCILESSNTHDILIWSPRSF